MTAAGCCDASGVCKCKKCGEACKCTLLNDKGEPVESKGSCCGSKTEQTAATGTESCCKGGACECGESCSCSDCKCEKCPKR